MAKTSITETLAPVAQLIAEEAGCELVDIEFVKEAGNWFLRVYIDKAEGVSLTDCENVSRPFSKKLDEMDPIAHEFSLEVSSSGGRSFKNRRDFENAIGRTVEVKLYKAVDGAKYFEGELISYDGGNIVIKTDNNEKYEFEIEKIEKVNKVFKL